MVRDKLNIKRFQTGEADTQYSTSLYGADIEACPVVITVLA